MHQPEACVGHADKVIDEKGKLANSARPEGLHVVQPAGLDWRHFHEVSSVGSVPSPSLAFWPDSLPFIAMGEIRP